MLKVVNIARSTSLQELGASFKVSKEGGFNIKHLRDLNKLRGRLHIEGLENVKSNEEALEAKLADKERLTELELWWNCDQESCNPEVEVEVLEGLCPPKDLEKLRLVCYRGVRYPNWMVGRQNGGLKCLQELELWECSLLGLASVFEVFTLLRVLYLKDCICMSLPDNVAHLKSLEKLFISSFPNIQSLPVLPQSLKKLFIFNCPNIQSLPVLPQTLEILSIYCLNIHSLSVLPQSLTELSIDGCPNINSFPELPQSLTELSIDNCPNIQSLPVLPQSLTELSIDRCQNIQSLPVLPQSLEKFNLRWCNEVLMRSCETIGDPNWQKMQHIHKKQIGPSSCNRGVHFDDDVSDIGPLLHDDVSDIGTHVSAGCRCLIL